MGTERGEPSVASAALVGAGGFLGAHLVRGFEARGARVLPLVRQVEVRSPSGARTFDDAFDDPGLLAGVDVVLHVASVSARNGHDARDERTATLDLLDRAMHLTARARVPRFVLVSSVGVYGFPSRLPVTEDHPYAPRTAHAATRVEAEMRARRAARDLALDLVIARATAVYGPGDRHGPLAAMAAMIRAGTYRVVGPGDNVLHHMHVDDAVEGLWLAAAHPDAAADHFLLAGPETTTLAALSERVSRAVGRPLARRHVPASLARAVATLVDVAANRGMAFTSSEAPLVHAKLDGLTLPLWFDTTKARRRLGFVPRVGYEEGIMRTLRGEWPALARAGAAP
jgi:nucleoside-diphosphate-sugar epimerase